MPNFAVIDNNRVVNVMVADSQSTAESVSGCAVIETDGSPWTGWTLEADGWRPPSPHPSWNWDGAAWAPPTPIPESTEPGRHEWDEDSQAWIFLPDALGN